MNKLLIKMIIEQLLEDTFAQTLIRYTYKIEKTEYEYKIIVTAILQDSTTTISKYRPIRIKNWVELLVGYEEEKKRLQHSLIDNIRKANYNE